MEIFEHDKNRKAYYVFPENIPLKDAVEEVAKTKHINPEKLVTDVGWVKGDELFMRYPIKGSKKMTVIFKRTKTHWEDD